MARRARGYLPRWDLRTLRYNFKYMSLKGLAKGEEMTPKEKKSQRMKAYYLQNRERILARAKGYYWENRKEILAHAKAKAAADRTRP